MKILDDVISTIKEDCKVKEVRTCVFWTAVVSKRCGLASTTRDQTLPHPERPVGGVGTLAGRSASELAKLAYSESSLSATIGMAAINSILEVDSNKCKSLNAGEMLLEKGAGKKIALVGYFPFIPRVRKVAKEFWIFEKLPFPDTLPESEAEKFIPQADVVALSGTTFINHSIEKLLSLCKDNAYVMVLGPTTPLSPVLFDYGIDVISGTMVTDTEKVLRYISEGATFRQIKEGVKLLTMLKDERR
jgi:hypothetical protein